METKQLKVSIYFQEINKKYKKKTSQLYAGDPDGGVLAAAGQEVVRGAGAELEPGHRGLVPAQHLQGSPGGARLRTWGKFSVLQRTQTCVRVYTPGVQVTRCTAPLSRPAATR